MYVNVANKSKGNSNQINSGSAQLLEIAETFEAPPYLFPTDQATDGFFHKFNMYFLIVSFLKCQQLILCKALSTLKKKKFRSLYMLSCTQYMFRSLS